MTQGGAATRVRRPAVPRLTPSNRASLLSRLLSVKLSCPAERRICPDPKPEHGPMQPRGPPPSAVRPTRAPRLRLDATFVPARGYIARDDYGGTGIEIMDLYTFLRTPQSCRSLECCTLHHNRLRSPPG